MHRFVKTALASSVAALFAAGLAVGPSAWAQEDDDGGAKAEAPKAMSPLEEGKKIAEDRTKGNCLACHVMGDGESPGNIGPPLVAMKARFPDKAKLREQIWDATVKNPISMMPPFGKHGAMSEQEIDKVVEYIYTL